jgi:hypothetical protein
MQFTHVADEQIAKLRSFIGECESEEGEHDHRNNDFVNLSETFRDALDAFAN